MNPIKGYKVTNENMRCQGYQFELGKMHSVEGTIRICNNGFHFCEKAAHCFNYYGFTSSNRVFEIEASGDMDEQTDKKCSRNITLIRELTWAEVLKVVNDGADNTGLGNTGDWNTGNRNTGDRNTGDWNTGDSNTGNRNTGNRNTGDWNTGDWNTGDWNTGDRNTGYSNTGNRNTGIFCTGEPDTLKIFNKESGWTLDQFLNSNVYTLLRGYIETKIWIPDHKMTEEEKVKYPAYKTAEGYVRDIPFKEAFQNAWHNFNALSRQSFKDLPNFDAAIFEEITGVKI